MVPSGRVAPPHDVWGGRPAGVAWPLPSVPSSCHCAADSVGPDARGSGRQKGRTVARPFVSAGVRYCCLCCGDLVTVTSLSTWLSTEYKVKGWYISSQLCSDQ
jgi:hypothetical protein